MDKAAGILSANLGEKLILHDVASSLKIPYLIFGVKYYKLPPGECRIKKRIEKGQELLQEGVNVKETSAQLGYSDAYSFSRQFKQVTGISPGKYINFPF